MGCSPQTRSQCPIGHRSIARFKSAVRTSTLKIRQLILGAIRQERRGAFWHSMCTKLSGKVFGKHLGHPHNCALYLRRVPGESHANQVVWWVIPVL
jgi:hypothetical protein